ncbi:MAG: alanine/glycine:cation symporter family protein [Angelakisella sp.]|nr:alanine/glycine:cation symporter family protein [Angelakisella sp.]
MQEFFSNLVNSIEAVNSAINNVVWGPPMLALILCTGIYMTVSTKFFQVLRAKFVSSATFLAIFTKASVTKSGDHKSISQFQALSTALAATIGTGNIAGVATAVVTGGPGAVFWMWVSAFFGMMTNYSENVLGIYYRKRNIKNEWSGGAMYYLEEGLKDKKGLRHVAKPLACLFALFCVMASFGIGNMTQINSISDALYSSFSIPKLASGIALAVLAALVIIGGIKRIGKVSEKLVPFMAAIYIIASVTVLVLNWHQIPDVFGSIFRSAFCFEAVAGGAAGVVMKNAITMGFKRGVFSNEAGLGSSVMVHSASDVKEPVIQGAWGIFEVFFDTIIVCSLTAFVVISTLSTPSHAPVMSVSQAAAAAENGATVYFTLEGTAQDGVQALITDMPNIVQSPSGGTVYSHSSLLKASKNAAGSISISAVSGVPLVSYAFESRFGAFAGGFVSVAILLFAFSTVLGWSYYGEKSMEYLLGAKAVTVYKVIFVCFIVVGATLNLGLAWDISDTLNGLMAVPNLIGVLLLSGTVIKITNNFTRRKLSKNPEDIEPMVSAYADIQKVQAAAIQEEEQVTA